MLKKIIFSLIIIGLLMPICSWAQQESPVKPPENLQESQKIGEQMIETSDKILPGIIKKTFYEEVLPVWRKMWNWFYIHFGIKIKNWFDVHLKPEIDKRIKIFKERFYPEKEELKQEIKTEVPTWWQRLKEFFK